MCVSLLLSTEIPKQSNAFLHDARGDWKKRERVADDRHERHSILTIKGKGHSYSTCPSAQKFFK